MAISQKQKHLTRCFKFVSLLPVLFILLLIGWSYYAYIYCLCIVVLITFYHIFLILFLWSYAVAVFTSPITPPIQFKLLQNERSLLTQQNWTDSERNSFLEKIIVDRNLPVYLVGSNGNIRVCLTCGYIKPDRCHHCSTCGVCLLKMDHHCPWTNNCVGFHNHKYFIIFLAWGTIYCLFIACTAAPYFPNLFSPLDNISANGFQVLFVFIVALMFGICQFTLCVYHLYLVGSNRTTLETFNLPRMRDGPEDKRLFNLGIRSNLRETFGSSCFKAMMPINTTQGDGVNWRFRVSYSNVEFGGEESSISLPIPNSTK